MLVVNTLHCVRWSWSHRLLWKHVVSTRLFFYTPILSASASSSLLVSTTKATLLEMLEGTLLHSNREEVKRVLSRIRAISSVVYSRFLLDEFRKLRILFVELACLVPIWYIHTASITQGITSFCINKLTCSWLPHHCWSQVKMMNH